MKKSMVALAVLGTLAGTASAQTVLSIYGLIDAGLVAERGGPAGSINKLTSGVQNGSRLGFKGNEDLGGGLSAKFLLESGFNVDNGTMGQGGLLFGRQAYVGLGGHWGNVLLGRQYTPHYLTLSEIDPFKVGLAGNALNLVTTTQRMNNTVKYTMPEWSGIVGEVAYGFGEVPGDAAGNRQFGASVGYNNGPLLVKLAHQRIENATSTDHGRNTLLAGKYDFGPAAASLGVNYDKGPSAIDDRDYLIGVSVPLGPSGTVLASYIRKDDRTSLDRDANQWALGYTHAVSKRTNFYTSYGHINNHNGSTYTVGNATETGSGDKAFNVGMRHLF